MGGGGVSIPKANWTNWSAIGNENPQGASIEGAGAGDASQSSNAASFGALPLFPNSTLSSAATYEFDLSLPPTWSSAAGISFSAMFYLRPSSSASGSAVFKVRTYAVSSGSTMGTYGAPVSVTVGGIAPGRFASAVISGTTANLLQGATPGGTLHVQFFRDHSAPGDSLADTPAIPLLLPSLTVGYTY